jgi:ParB family transcriptional regulator, chromosome partitioning protein
LRQLTIGQPALAVELVSREQKNQRKKINIEWVMVTENLGNMAMADDATRSRLGRGLAALIGEVSAETSAERPRGQRKVPTGSLRPNPRNPRRVFSNTELDDLVASLRERGIIQPIIVRAVRGAAESFEIIAGERRWRAAQRAGLHEVPVVTIEATDAEALQIAIIENVQRADLNALEEAEGYHALMEEFGNSQDEVAKTIGKSRSHVANTLRLLKLPETVKSYIANGKLTAGHARMLIGQSNAEQLAEDIVARGLNVRQVEALARETGQKNAKGSAKGSKSSARDKNANLIALEKRISDALGLIVNIDDRQRGGVLTIRYRNLDQLDEVLRRLEKTS